MPLDMLPVHHLILHLTRDKPICWYQKQPGRVPSVLAADRLVGTHITSTKPIAVTLGDDSVQKAGAYDFMGDQSIPTVNAQNKSVIGYEYIVMKGKISDLGGGNNEKAYVLTTKPNTSITVTRRNGTIVTYGPYGAGIQLAIDLLTANNDYYVHIKATEPVYVLHIAGFGDELGDAILPTIDGCTGSLSVSFTRSKNQNFYLNLMTKADAIDSFYISINGGPATHFLSAANFEQAGTSDWYVLKDANKLMSNLTIPTGSVTRIFNTKNVFHLGYFNGVNTGGGCVYGYISDYSELEASATVEDQGSVFQVCGVDSIELKAKGGISYHWSPSEYLDDPNVQNPILRPPDGVYSQIFTVEIGQPCYGMVTLQVFVNIPECPDAFRPEYVPLAELRGWWSFSGNAFDESGNAIASAVNGPVLSTDRHNREDSAFVFDGLNDWINLYDNDILNIHKSDWTISAWIKTTSSAARIFSKGTHGGPQPGYDLMIYPNSGGRAAVIFGTGHEHIVQSNNPVNDNKWHLITGVIDRDDVVKLYVDGILQASAANISDHATADIADGTYNASMGASYCYNGSPDSPNEFFTGNIDEVGVWGRVLSQCEILDLYHENSGDTLLTVSLCDSYTAPDGAIYTTSGIKTAVIPNSAGCDSTITIDLTILKSTSGNLIISSCDSYTAPDGAIYTTSGIKTAVIPNSAGCDSTITIDLTVLKSTSGNLIISSCDSYTAPDGAIYTTSGIKTAVIPNSAGCDSTITIDLTVLKSTSGNLIISSCDSYTAPDGAIYTTSGIKTAVIPNSAGCDSTITIDLTVLKSTSSNLIISSCDSYTAPDGAIYTTSGIKIAVIPNSAGCDSIISINLTINIIDITISREGNILTVFEPGALYQWLDCDNKYKPLINETNQTLICTTNGNFAVEVVKGACTDTSAIEEVSIFTSIENIPQNGIMVYPNPTNGIIHVDLEADTYEGKVVISDLNGSTVKEIQFNNQRLLTITLNEPSGTYFITIISNNNKTVFRLVKN